MFQISYDPQRDLVTFVQEGYWEMEEFRAFEAEFLAIHAQIRKQNKSYRMFADGRKFAVQSAEVSEAFSILFEKFMVDNLERLAILASSMLNRIQAQRTVPKPNVRVFTDELEAMSWLFEDASLPKK